jgi:hypothetical protein
MGTFSRTLVAASALICFVHARQPPHRPRHSLLVPQRLRSATCFCYRAAHIAWSAFRRIHVPQGRALRRRYFVLSEACSSAHFRSTAAITSGCAVIRPVSAIQPIALRWAGQVSPPLTIK